MPRRIRKVEGPRCPGMRSVFGWVGLEVGLHEGWTKASDCLGRLLPRKHSVFGWARLGLRGSRDEQGSLRPGDAASSVGSSWGNEGTRWNNKA